MSSEGASDVIGGCLRCALEDLPGSPRVSSAGGLPHKLGMVRGPTVEKGMHRRVQKCDQSRPCTVAFPQNSRTLERPLENAGTPYYCVTKQSQRQNQGESERARERERKREKEKEGARHTDSTTETSRERERASEREENREIESEIETESERASESEKERGSERHTETEREMQCLTHTRTTPHVGEQELGR